MRLLVEVWRRSGNVESLRALLQAVPGMKSVQVDASTHLAIVEIDLGPEGIEQVLAPLRSAGLRPQASLISEADDVGYLRYLHADPDSLDSVWVD
ncbi:MAG: hypothetical protein ACJ8F7_03540 [Gemmataceae bacterium]